MGDDIPVSGPEKANNQDEDNLSSAVGATPGLVRLANHDATLVMTASHSLSLSSTMTFLVEPSILPPPAISTGTDKVPDMSCPKWRQH